jgi:uncharacterized linocin/CFP29 family protein
MKMAQDNSQVSWTDEQWARVNQVIQEEASRARVAASFLPLYGPLPASTDFVRDEAISYPALTPEGTQHRIAIADTDTIKLPTLQVKVHLRGAQMADPEMTSVLALFRRAANVLARLEDAVIFNGQTAPGHDGKGAAKGALGDLPRVWEILGGQDNGGLLGPDSAGPEPRTRTAVPVDLDGGSNGQHLVKAVSDCIGKLEGKGHFGPFAVVLDQKLFLIAQTPDPDSLVLPQDRIIPFLGGGSLLRSSTLPDHKGVVVALGGAPVELVVATDMSLQFLQVTTDPMFVFRVFEKMALRIKERTAIMAVTLRTDAHEPPEEGRPPRRR